MKKYILYEENDFWTDMHFWGNEVVCLLSLDKTSREKIAVKNA